jgi:hypothetical protein
MICGYVLGAAPATSMPLLPMLALLVALPNKATIFFRRVDAKQQALDESVFRWGGVNQPKFYSRQENLWGMKDVVCDGVEELGALCLVACCLYLPISSGLPFLSFFVQFLSNMAR